MFGVYCATSDIVAFATSVIFVIFADGDIKSLLAPSTYSHALKLYPGFVGVISDTKHSVSYVHACDSISGLPPSTSYTTVNVTVNGTVIYGDAIHFEKPSNWGNNINVYF